MDYLPLHFDLRGRRSLVVGGGRVAVRKVRQLLGAQAAVWVIAPVIDAEIGEMADKGSIEVYRRPFRSDDLEGAVIVIAATDDKEVQEQVHAECRDRNIPINVVDRTELCTFIFPSIIDRSPVLVSISSSASSPTISSYLRSILEPQIPAAFGQLATFIAEFRTRFRGTFSSTDQARRFWQGLIEGPLGSAVLRGDSDTTSRLSAELIARFEAGHLQEDSTAGIGEVYIVGAGPGDPELLTLRAFRLMQRADVILHDRLVSSAVLDMARRDAERFDVGKQGVGNGDAGSSQEDINDRMLAWAKAGKRVLRLKGGDPFVFGRGGEELEFLLEHDIPVEVVPGITAAVGCAAYSGIPLTHRDVARSVRFVTARTGGDSDLEWSRFLPGDETLVFYMVHGRLAAIREKLTGNGFDGTTPVAAIQSGTTSSQRQVITTLAELPESVAQAGLGTPLLVIVGRVVLLTNHTRSTGTRGSLEDPTSASPALTAR